MEDFSRKPLIKGEKAVQGGSTTSPKTGRNLTAAERKRKPLKFQPRDSAVHCRAFRFAACFAP
jgi:hypothetical protein